MTQVQEKREESYYAERKRKRGKFISFQLEDRDHKKFRAIAAMKGVNMSQLTTKLVKEFIASHKVSIKEIEEG